MICIYDLEGGRFYTKFCSSLANVVSISSLRVVPNTTVKCPTMIR